ncbi:unnamed protein product [Euphydryas editha]|uniref:Uncharacterized protein n=1 Tax=Euphydryas editha TaxID=104508 RepID=A0AAU9TQZ6_EUPED|nr:unnamed protein product [Euphydryas editha]
MFSVYLLLICSFVFVSSRPYEDRVEIKDREKEDSWRPIYGSYDYRIKSMKNKDKYDDKMLIDSGRPYYPGFNTFPLYFWEGFYNRPAYVYPELNYFIRKEVKDKSILKIE